MRIQDTDSRYVRRTERHRRRLAAWTAFCEQRRAELTARLAARVERLQSESAQLRSADEQKGE